MEIRHYIFLTNEGVTYQPSEICSDESIIENMQVIGCACGMSSEIAFQNLLKSNTYIKETTFKDVFCYELHKDYLQHVSYFTI